ncbi:MAG: tRNA uridine-5-carboxymethylaminomethyl(34) synthesis enzyme MnmG [Holophagaceae bacterium]
MKLMKKGSRVLVVIGGGHAGIEAAHISARLGITTHLLTMSVEQIGQMSCNPSIGGVGKGHMVREIDALGGLMAHLIDQTGIHFRVLNASRGMAVRGPRAQADKVKYRRYAQSYLTHLPNLNLHEGLAVEILFEEASKKIEGVRLQDGSLLPCDAIVLTSGTFLNGKILIGDEETESGRQGEPASTQLASQLRSLGLHYRRLKTGTSPRIFKGSINFDVLEPQPGDTPPHPFSFFTHHLPQPQVNCYLVSTNKQTEDIVRGNLQRSALYGGMISGVGPRYCPSLEDKYVKFPHRERHQIFVEPESLETEEIYLSGFSTSMPKEVQLEMVRSLQGFEKAEIVRPGYAIEYDSFDPLQLDQTLRLKDYEGLWFAGQINGTTGYEEAAGQGLMAGINAARWLLNQEPVILHRDQAYIGVMIDDLVSKGTDEPYRMLTARAEHRLGLACDLADVRLLETSKMIGALTKDQLRAIEEKTLQRKKLRHDCDTTWVTANTPFGKIGEHVGLHLDQGLTLSQFMKKLQLTSTEIDACLALVPSFKSSLSNWDQRWERDLLVYELRYQAYRDREEHLLEQQRQWDFVRIPEDFFIERWPGFSNEVIEKLRKHRPETLGQASRIPGITPAAVTLLHFVIEKSRTA